MFFDFNCQSIVRSVKKLNEIFVIPFLKKYGKIYPAALLKPHTKAKVNQHKPKEEDPTLVHFRGKEKESKMRTQTVRYRVYEEWITHPQLGRYCCYGIVCESYLPKHGWQLQQAVSDITDDRNAAEALAALMQQEDLEPCHLLDVVEDYLNGM